MKILYYSWDIKEDFNYPQFLENKGYDVHTTSDEEIVIDAIDNNDINILIFDTTSVLNFKKLFKIIEKTRDQISYLAITEANNSFILEDALTLGLDDYFLDSLTVNQFIAKFDSFVKIATSNKIPRHVKLLKAGNIELNPSTREVTKAGREVLLTNKEFNLLELLLKNKGKVVTRKKLIDAFWPSSESNVNNSPDVYVTFLRRKIEKPGEPRIIKTIRNIGYTVKD